MTEKMKNSMDGLKTLLMGEIDKIVAKGDITPVEMENAQKALKVIEMICHIERGEDPDEGFSQKNYYIRDWEDPMRRSYDTGNSYARGRSPYTGRYVSRDNMPNASMSYGGDHDYMMSSLEQAMQEAGSEHDRMLIRNLMSQMTK